MEQERVEAALRLFLVVGFVVVASHPLVAADLEPVRLSPEDRPYRHPSEQREPLVHRLDRSVPS